MGLGETAMKNVQMHMGAVSDDQGGRRRADQALARGQQRRRGRRVQGRGQPREALRELQALRPRVPQDHGALHEEPRPRGDAGQDRGRDEGLRGDAAAPVKILEMVKANKLVEAHELMRDARKEADAVETKLAALVDAKVSVAKKLADEAEAGIRAATNFMLGAILLAVVLAVGTWASSSPASSRARWPRRRACCRRSPRATSPGGSTLDTTDEVGRMAAALNPAVDGMRAALQEVQPRPPTTRRRRSQQLSAASEQLSSGRAGAGVVAGRDGGVAGGDHRHRQAERRQRAAGEPARGGVARRGGEGRAGRGERRCASMTRDQPVVEEDRGHHHDDRRDRVPDQPPRAERRGRGGARRRAGPRLRGGGVRGAQPGAAVGDGGEGDQGADPGLACRRWRPGRSW